MKIFDFEKASIVDSGSDLKTRKYRGIKFNNDNDNKFYIREEKKLLMGCKEKDEFWSIKHQ